MDIYHHILFIIGPKFHYFELRYLCFCFAMMVYVSVFAAHCDYIYRH